MQIVIVGAGAIGMLIGTFLVRGGHKVTFVEPRKDAVDTINKEGIWFMDSGEESESGEMAFEQATAVMDASELAQCDLVILAVKSYDTHAAVKAVTHLITKDSPLLSLQAGLGNLEIIEKLGCRDNLLGGLTFMAGAALGPGQVRLGGLGTTYIGELDGTISSRVTKLLKLFNDCGLETEQVDNIIKRLWCKVVVYSAINPLTAILRVKNDQLLEKMESINLAKRLIDEARHVAAANDVDLSQFDLYQLFFDTCHRTADNISSMLLDLISGRRTEIQAFNGEVVRLGQLKNIPVTTNMSLVELVTLAEKWGEGVLGQA